MIYDTEQFNLGKWIQEQYVKFINKSILWIHNAKSKSCERQDQKQNHIQIQETAQQV